MDHCIFASSRTPPPESPRPASTWGAFVESTAIDAPLAVAKDTKAPLWRSLFGTYRPSERQRPKLGDELEQVRIWPDLLRAAPTQALRDRAASAEKLVKAAAEAVKAQGNARVALQVFKSSKPVPLLARTNAARSTVADDGEKQSFDGTICPEAAQVLFRLTARPKPARPDTVASVQAEIAAGEKELTRLHQVLAALQATDAQTERRRTDQETLTALQTAHAQSAQKIAELEKRLQN